MWFLRVPKPNEKYIDRSHAKNPFVEGYSYIVTVEQVRKGWVRYELSGGSFGSNSLLDFWMFYKRLK